MWNLFKKQINWEKEFNILYKYTMKLEQNLNKSIDLNKKMLNILEKKNEESDGNPKIYE